MPGPLRQIATLVAIFVSVAGVLLGCTTGARRESKPSVASTPRPAAPRDLHAETREAVDGIVSIISKDLRLPVPTDVAVRLYDSRGAFEQGLINEARVSPARATELSAFAVGIAVPRQVLLVEDAAKNWQEWLRLIGHELTHVAQFELAGGEGRAEQWLAEGMAEWVSFTALERMGKDSLARRRRIAAAQIPHQAALARAQLDLKSLGLPRGFTIRHQREGSVPTYQLAFVMTDYLIERHGLPRVIEYFRLLAWMDRYRAFEKGFGQSIEAFETEILAHLTEWLRTTPDAGDTPATAHWVVTSTSGARSVYVRNTSADSIQLTSVTVADCANLPARVCGQTPLRIRVSPGETVLVRTVPPSADPSRPSSFRYRYAAETVR